MTQMPNPNSISKHRPKRGVVFTDAETLWALFRGYKDHCKTNMVPIGSKGRMVPRPMTKEGLAVFCGCGISTIKRAALRSDLKDTWEAIQSEIDDDLVIGGLTRALDSNLVARVAGIADKQHIETNDVSDRQEYDFGKLTSDELETLTVLLEKAAIDDTGV